jgi:hypothetical protein
VFVVVVVVVVYFVINSVQKLLDTPSYIHKIQIPQISLHSGFNVCCSVYGSNLEFFLIQEKVLTHNKNKQDTASILLLKVLTVSGLQ